MRVCTSRSQRCMIIPLLLVLYAAGEIPPTTPATPPMYWCPDRTPDQQLGATAEPGCVPLVTEEALRRPPLKVEEMPGEVSRFLGRYREFLECCPHDVGSLDRLEALEEQATDLLRVAQRGLFSEQIRLRGFWLRELIPPVARARDDLRAIKQRLEQIREAMEQLESMEYELEARERRRLEQEQEAIKREFRPRLPPPSPPTGVEIGVTPPMGPGIGTVPPTGPEIGVAPPTGLEVGVTPPTGREIGQTPPTGFEIGTAGRVGPEIGESTLNLPRE